MRHLVPTRGHLLHHEERKPHEPEPVAEILHDDAAAHEPHRLRLEPCQQRIDRERKVENAAQREERAPQSAVGDIVAREQRSQKECPGAERAVVQPDLLVGKPQPSGRGIRLEEQRHDLHHEALAQAVEDDEGDVIPDMLFREERRDHLLQAAQPFPQRMSVSRTSARRQLAAVVNTQQDEQAAKDRQHHRPRLHIGIEGRRPGIAETLAEPAREPDQAARGDQFRKVVERPLPADIPRLILGRELRHVNAVGRDVVRGAAEGHHREDPYRDGEEMGHMQRQRSKAEQHAAQELRRNDEEFFGAENFQEGAPQEFDRPRPHDQRRPERDPGVGNPHILEHDGRDHVQHDERKPHRKIDRRHPGQRRSFFNCRNHRVFSGFRLGMHKDNKIFPHAIGIPGGYHLCIRKVIQFRAQDY